MTIIIGFKIMALNKVQVSTLLKKIDAFSAESETLSAKFCHIFQVVFFANSEKTTKSKFRQETLNVLSTLKFVGSHLAFYE